MASSQLSLPASPAPTTSHGKSTVVAVAVCDATLDSSSANGKKLLIAKPKQRSYRTAVMGTTATVAFLLLVLKSISIFRRRTRFVSLAAAIWGSIIRLRRTAEHPRRLWSLPSWPPPPRTLLREGSLAAAVAAVLLFASGLCSITTDEREEEDSRQWAARARRQRQIVLEDLLRPLPLDKLIAAVPSLVRHIPSELAALAAGTSSSTTFSKEAVLWESGNKNIWETMLAEDGSVSDDEPVVFDITAETIADAAESLAKTDCNSPIAWQAYAIASALTACELTKAVDALNATEKEGDSQQACVADLDALRARISAADEFSSRIAAQCPTRRLAHSIQDLYKEPMHVAMSAVRCRRRAQLRIVAGMLWRFRSTLPFIAISSAVSVVLGSFSAMRLHYQAAVINLAKDAVTTGGGSSKIGETIGAMVVSEVITQLAEFARAQLANRGKMRIVRELKVALFRALLRQDLEYLEQCDLWQLRSLIGSCGTTVGHVVNFPATAVECCIKVFSALCALWGKSGRLTVFLIVALPSRSLLGHLVDLLSDRLERRKFLPDFRGQINACWSGLVRPATLRTMRTFAREPIEASVFERFMSTHDKLQERGQLVYNLLQPLHAVTEQGLQILTLWVGGRLAVRGEVDFGGLASFMLVAQGAFDSAQYLRAVASHVGSQALGPLVQMVSLLTRQPRIGLDEPAVGTMPDARVMTWNISFEDVSFAYPSRPGAWALRGLSFTANSGEFLGILGATGAGKSTIFALLLRLYEPSEGRILLDGRDLREYNPLWLRRNIGFVSQELVLCQRTIRENLLYGCTNGASAGVLAAEEERPDEEARAALRIAQCEDCFFDAAVFPSLWHTDVGDGGSDLSGGQRQRLGLARALLKEPRLLLLDEATSALDELSQARLQDSLEEVRRREGITVICIAHRLSNLSKADRLLVLEGGHAVESGTPSDLVSRLDGRFAEYLTAHRDSLSCSLGRLGAPSDGSDAAEAQATTTASATDVLEGGTGDSDVGSVKNMSPNESSASNVGAGAGDGTNNGAR
eukprot:TRINITY_DN54598_c0_g1_i1.p1 TRINITY_DN54598_c0_g1~~TRINITY_DN54598_c0_g1_i1.p1  ORF type:complete len:1032 (+),score=157.06 TRINITY_DN54598_c0_g1_i1:78-3173(+)